ncbi:MAG TPA: serine/threonine-protein kinase [Burkholderiales bacterium]
MQTPKTLGRYRVLDELGRGAMGAVYRAVDPLIEREVAVKTLLPDLPAEIMAEVRERFLREARSAGRLSHPNIVTIFDVGEQDGVAYIAMELLPGRSLQQMLREHSRIAAGTAAEIAAQVADALDHAQQYRIVHRDVKPANVMIAPSGRCKLTDFGIAYVPTSTMTQTGEALGSPRYMSPEQVAGIPVDGRSDIFSLGVVLYEMLAGRNPFQRETDTTPLTIMHRIAVEPHTPLRQLDPTLPPAFDRILARALAKKPQERYARAADMAAELRKAAGESAYEKTVKVDKTVKLDVRNPLLDDLEDFARRFDVEQEERRRAAEAEKRRQEEELRLRQEAEERRRREEAARAAQAAAAQARKPSALDALRSAPSAPQRESPAMARQRALDTFDRDLRAAYRYLAEFGGEVNSRTPLAAKPYDLHYVGRVPVSLSDAWVDTRPRRVAGKECCQYIYLRYRVNPEPPAKFTLLGPDIERCQQFLKSLDAQFELRVEARNDFGQPRRATFVVSGKLLCEVEIEADYESMALSLELVNVRRIGRRQCRIPADKAGGLADDLARYLMGVDEELEKSFAK